jgi:hypothetical protein
MNRSFASPILLAASLAIAAPAIADSRTSAAASGTQTASFADSIGSSTPTGSPGASKRFGWAGIGYYNAASTGFFGFNIGAALDVLPLTPELPLSVFGNVALAFSSDVLFPLTAGAAVHYDKLPVLLLGGVGFTIMPHSGAGGTPVGLALLGMASYPLPQIRPGVSGMAQIQYHILDDGFSLFVIDVGLEMGF